MRRIAKRPKINVRASNTSRGQPIRWLAAICVALPAILLDLGCNPKPFQDATVPAEPIRAVWVTRFHYRTPRDIAAIMRNIRELGANTVLWQVRGEGTVAYPSRLEPWSREFNHRDPGFDPLELAVKEAHANALKIHAWCNTYTGWKGKRPPLDGQLFATHPEWFLRDENGRLPSIEDFYMPLNPCSRDARAHLVAVFEEIATRYDVDGIQLDYVRYVLDMQKSGKERFPRDAETLAQYRRQTGRHPNDDLNAWHHWRSAQIGALVGDVREMLARRRPKAMLSASVWASPLNGYRDYMQNAVAWLNAGLLDAVFTMTYTADARNFAEWVDLYRRNCPGRRVIPGLGLYKQDREAQTREQLQLCRQWGPEVALYSYDSLFEGLDERQSARTRAERSERRAAVLAEFHLETPQE